MPLAPNDIAFLEGPFRSIPGWCYEDAAWFTTHLLRYQQREGRFAPCFEIGIYQGKYFSVFRNASVAAGMAVYGFDTFEWIPVLAVEEHMTKAFGGLDGIHLIPGDTTKFSTAEVNSHLGGQKAAFISIDGAHTADAVFSDLRLAEAALAPWGIIAIDDFLNAMAIGVTDGALRYWHKCETNLVPFCYCSNKLFVAHKEFAEEYSAQSLQFAEENMQFSSTKRMIENMRNHGLHWAKQELLGMGVWIMRPYPPAVKASGESEAS